MYFSPKTKVNNFVQWCPSYHWDKIIYFSFEQKIPSCDWNFLHLVKINLEAVHNYQSRTFDFEYIGL